MVNLVKNNIRIILLVLACTVISVPATGGAASAAGADWKLEANAKFQYNTNVFKLSDNQIDGLDRNSNASQTSGRFNDMESAGDFILTPGIKGSLKTDGFNGNTLTITPSAKYNLYFENSEKSHLELAITARQDLGSNNSVALKGSYRPEVFKKNYLTNTTVTQNVLSENKRYSPASYDALAAEVSYRHRLWKGAKTVGNSAIQKVTGELLLGLQEKEYSSGFSSRNEDNFLFGAGVDMEFANNYEVSLTYLYKVVDTENGVELLVRDEAIFGDMNTDGDALDGSVAINERVDRSHTDHTFRVKASGVLNPEWDWHASYDVRFQHYDSTEQFDITRKDRDDTRHRFGVGAKSEIYQNVNLALNWKYITEEAGRDALKAIDPAESKSYDVMIFAGTLTYKF